ncbi:hypothetical protein P153DRAFT_185074 [Dothidotthia symphoricarpi CBS 119687]|uniref:Uncharacterized protein n=1 Tax=Dothidotthia symphoricarpi CBS 119687 TaxID=1392245 RepID=A0A6A6AMI8_9PLEO|nr:uncharacterized protein P153DRAFT_185074 [Dothidotthia symphoricarpi CBS 119687]KAF2132144.1 hypothetical protein P153DRAFT_185074 [Dothidotthia symphoricarpi CBS 119687]
MDEISQQEAEPVTRYPACASVPFWPPCFWIRLDCCFVARRLWFSLTFALLGWTHRRHSNYVLLTRIESSSTHFTHRIDATY